MKETEFIRRIWTWVIVGSSVGTGLLSPPLAAQTPTPVAISPRDTTGIRGAPDVSLFNFDGTSAGSFEVTDPVQDLAFHPTTGDLFALQARPNGGPGIIRNLTTGVAVDTQGLDLFFNQSSDIAIADDVIAISPRDTSGIRGAPDVSLFNFDGTSAGSFEVTNPVQDLTFHPTTGDLFALQARPNGGPGIIRNLTTGVAVDTQGLNLLIGSQDADIALQVEQAVVIPGDLDGDGDVDMNDLMIVVACFGQFVADNPACAIADVAPPPTGDGIINILDISFVGSSFTP